MAGLQRDGGAGRDGAAEEELRRGRLWEGCCGAVGDCGGAVGGMWGTLAGLIALRMLVSGRNIRGVSKIDTPPLF